MEEEDKFLPRHLANNGISSRSRLKMLTDEQKFGRKIKIRSSLHFDEDHSDVDQKKNNKCGTHLANAAPVGKKCVGAIVEPSILLRKEFSSNEQQQQQQQHENVNNNNSRKSRRLVVRSLSDGAKSVSSNSWPNDPHYHDCFHHNNNNNNNESTEKLEGGQRKAKEESRELELAFGSLSLTTAFKSLSDSKLFCCSKDVERERHRRRLTFVPLSNDFYLIQTFSTSQMQQKSIQKKVNEGNVETTKMLFLDEICLNSSLIATEVDDSDEEEEEVMIGRGQLVDDEDEDEYGSVIVLSSDQLKCPTTNGRGSLGSSASLELVRFFNGHHFIC